MSATPATPRLESRALTASIAATAVLGLLGVTWGIASGSQMILLDGAYGVIGIATSWLLLRASHLAVQAPSHAYPFGREAVTPLVIGIQGIVLIATLLYAALEALFTIRDGGSAFAPGLAILYGAIVTCSCLAVWLWLRGGTGHSDLIRAEATAWRIAALRGVGMLSGFSVLWLIDGTSWDGAAPYVDPAMVLITCVLFLPAPASMVRTTVTELLEGAPSEAVRRPVAEAIAAVCSSWQLQDPDVRITKVGAKLYVEVAALAAPHVTIAQQHDVRRDLERRLDTLPHEVWLNLELLPRDA